MPKVREFGVVCVYYKPIMWSNEVQKFLISLSNEKKFFLFHNDDKMTRFQFTLS